MQTPSSSLGARPRPLCFFASDAKAGQTRKRGLKGVWYVVAAAGGKIELGGGNSATTTTTSSGYGRGGC